MVVVVAAENPSSLSTFLADARSGIIVTKLCICREDEADGDDDDDDDDDASTVAPAA